MRTGGYLLILSLAAALACCSKSETAVTAEPTADVAQLYQPKAIEVLPFTKPRSFDDDPVPDGLEVSLRPVDAMGDPLKTYGSFLFELFEFRNASGDRSGARLETWTQPIVTQADQRQFWDRVTSTYSFQLVWEGGDFPPPDRKYLLEVTFQPVGGDRLFASYPFEFRLPRSDFAKARPAGG